jgi:hypothetical protein
MAWGTQQWGQIQWGWEQSLVAVGEVQTELGANYVDGVRYDDPAECVAAINQIPMDGETDVSTEVTIRLHIVSLLNAEIE